MGVDEHLKVCLINIIICHMFLIWKCISNYLKYTFTQYNVYLYISCMSIIVYTRIISHFNIIRPLCMHLKITMEK